MVISAHRIGLDAVYRAAYEANRLAAVVLPGEAEDAFRSALDRESKPMAQYVLGQILENAQLAVAENRPMCGDGSMPGSARRLPMVCSR